SQTSVAWDGVPTRAVDGITNGNFWATPNSVTHTASELQPWWTVDLGWTGWIDTVEVSNRTDCCDERLDCFYVFVTYAPFHFNTVIDTYFQAGVSTYRPARGSSRGRYNVPVGRTGRYVRIQLPNTGILSLAEVRVFGRDGEIPQRPGDPPPII